MTAWSKISELDDSSRPFRFFSHETRPPYGNTRRLISTADVGNNPGNSSPKDKKGTFLYEDAWKYLFTHPVAETGKPVRPEERCRGDF